MHDLDKPGLINQQHYFQIETKIACQQKTTTATLKIRPCSIASP
uniref:Uncharacterized protein n=1 Tax=Arundo donax TaxID=35708 RepID=A0A0A9B7P4_ARUDO